MPVYHRYLTPTQTEEDIKMQLQSLEIWGKAAKNIYQSDIPKVKAYVGKIPPGKVGIEFTTNVPPDPNTPPHLATWSPKGYRFAYGNRPGVRTEGNYALTKSVDYYSSSIMTALDSQNSVRLEAHISETRLVAIVRQEPAEIKMTNQLEFRPSFDDLDYLVFATLYLPNSARLGLIRHDNSPAPGTEICVKHDQNNIPKVLQEAIIKMKLTLEDFNWIHPDYEQQLRFNLITEDKNQLNN